MGWYLVVSSIKSKLLFNVVIKSTSRRYSVLPTKILEGKQAEWCYFPGMAVVPFEYVCLRLASDPGQNKQNKTCVPSAVNNGDDPGVRRGSRSNNTLLFLASELINSLFFCCVRSPLYCFQLDSGAVIMAMAQIFVLLLACPVLVERSLALWFLWAETSTMSSVLTMVLTAVILWKLWEWVVDFVFLQCYKIFFRSHFSFLTLPIFFFSCNFPVDGSFLT